MNAVLSQLVGHPLVLLEGCDGVGKTTIAAQLHRRHGYAVVHSPVTPSTVDLPARYHDLITTPGRRVLDRSFVSELVYGPLRRGRSRLTDEQAKRLASTASDEGGVLGHLSAGASVLQARLRDRSGEDVPSVEELRAVLDRYDSVIHGLSRYLTVIRFDTSAVPAG